MPVGVVAGLFVKTAARKLVRKKTRATTIIMKSKIRDLLLVALICLIDERRKWLLFFSM
ncbi:MAG: hypothetical protein ACREA4_01160 [Nitrososphaera sp.]